MKRCLVGIRRPGEPAEPAAANEAQAVWFASMATMAAVLPQDNQFLLRLIRERHPKALTEVADHTGRQAPNLSRTLRMMEGYGLVVLKKNA